MQANIRPRSSSSCSRPCQSTTKVNSAAIHSKIRSSTVGSSAWSCRRATRTSGTSKWIGACFQPTVRKRRHFYAKRSSTRHRFTITLQSSRIWSCDSRGPCQCPSSKSASYTPTWCSPYWRRWKFSGKSTHANLMNLHTSYGGHLKD